MSALSFAIRMILVFVGTSFFSFLGAWLMTEKFDEPHEDTGKVIGVFLIFVVAPLLVFWPFLPVTSDHAIIHVSDATIRVICISLLIIELIGTLIFLSYHLNKKRQLAQS